MRATSGHAYSSRCVRVSSSLGSRPPTPQSPLLCRWPRHVPRHGTDSARTPLHHGAHDSKYHGVWQARPPRYLPRTAPSTTGQCMPDQIMARHAAAQSRPSAAAPPPALAPASSAPPSKELSRTLALPTSVLVEPWVPPPPLPCVTSDPGVPGSNPLRCHANRMNHHLASHRAAQRPRTHRPRGRHWNRGALARRMVSRRGRMLACNVMVLSRPTGSMVRCRVVVRVCGSVGRAHHLVDLSLLLRHDAHNLPLSQKKSGRRAKVYRVHCGRAAVGEDAPPRRDGALVQASKFTRTEQSRGRTSHSRSRRFGTFGQQKPRDGVSVPRPAPRTRARHTGSYFPSTRSSRHFYI
jgi:hypothetical protein